MNKVYLSCLFLALLNPCFADYLTPIPINRKDADLEKLAVIESSQLKEEKSQDMNSRQSSLKKCQSPFHVMHIGLRHTEARGVGYHDGYTTLEGFGIYNSNTHFMPFIDLRGHVFDNGRLAGNAGLGGRSFFNSFEHVLGYYLYYDVRQDRHHLTAQQLGPGIELLGKRMEYRVNGYFPIGNRKSHKYDFDFDAFDGHHLLLKAKERHVLTGADAEIGAHLTQSTKYDLYAGAGPYYFSSSHASTWGGKTRLLGRFKEYVSLELSYSYDHLFHSVVQGSVAVNLPFGKRIKHQGDNCSSQVNLALSRAAFSPYRFEIPVIKRVSRKEKAINPATDHPWTVWFVDNTSSSNGSFESPFPTLAQAQNASRPYDMIYVFAGDGTTTGMDRGMTLQDGQKFFGSGIAHRIKTTKGKIKIPAFSKASPLITNTNGDVVTLANGNQVSGMNILATAAPFTGIIGMSINEATINNNTMLGNVDYHAIDIFGSGFVEIKNNQIVNSTDLSGRQGITIGGLENSFIKADISNNFISGFSQAILIPGEATSQADMTIANNVISDFFSDGVVYLNGFSRSTIRIIGNTIHNTMGGISPFGGIAVFVDSLVDSGTALIQNNTVITTTPAPNTNSISVEITAGATHLNTNITNNRVTVGSGAGSIGIQVMITTNNSSICSTITDNTVTQQAPSTNNFFQITTDVPTVTNSTINIDDFSGNTDQNIFISGNVNFVPKGTCE